MALLLLIISVLLSLAAFCYSFEPLNKEVEALVALKSSLEDPHGVLSNWDEDSVDPCSWAMITCSSLNLVVAIGAPSQSLSGTLSGVIGNLTNLEQILLQNNNITGEIPPELGELQRLQTLDLSNNWLSGDIPDSLGRLSALRYMRLNNNSLSGKFPASLSKLPQLSFLDLSFNNLSGGVPVLPARTFNIAGNPLICRRYATEGCRRTSSAVPIPPLPSFLEPPRSRTKKAQKLAVALGTSLGSTCSILACLAILLMWCQRRRQRHHRFVLGINNAGDSSSSSAVQLGNLRRFRLRELQAATNNFSPKNIVGKGGFGDVYLGRLSDGSSVAVKRLKDATGAAGESQFRTEVELISLAVHRHVLRLVGYCAAPSERLLVYPFMPNGSVASCLRGKPLLDWATRQGIAVGAARGLVYLHEQCDPKIIHRDVKAANVLLDERFEAVIGDLGLAKLLDHGDTHVTTAVRGTVGHIAPEYLSTGQSSDKTDVFGFGILLLELLSGRRAIEFGKVDAVVTRGSGAVLDWVRKVHLERQVEVMMDRDLGREYDRIEAAEMLQVAMLCTQNLPADRPKMSEVLRMLEGDGLADKWEASNRRPHHAGGGDDGAGDSAIDGWDFDGGVMGWRSHRGGVHDADEDEMELSGPR